MMTRKIASFITVLILHLGWGITPSQALDPQKAKSFVQDLGSQAINTLTSGTLSDGELKQKFRSLLEKGFDVKAIGKFSLGKYWRQVTPAQQQEFIELFQKQLETAYAARFKEYKGVQFDVQGARAEADGGVVVSSTLQKPGGPKTKVDWKIYGESPKIFDVIVEGVSMGISKRDDYASSIQQNGGDINRFLGALRGRG